MTEQSRVTLLMSAFVTHDVRRFVVTKPSGFRYQPGQAVELAINQPEWKDRGRPFTPTNLDDDQVLEFTIKGYAARAGVTRKLHSLPPGAELLLSAPFGTIRYQGPGVFLAAGSGITPFIAILRAQARAADTDRSTLFFSNRTPADIIYEKELRHYLGERCNLTCTVAKATGYEQRRIDETFLVEKIADFSQRFYVCGPPGFMGAINGALKRLGADPQNLIFER